MPGPPSDTATRAARQSRLVELLSEGKSQTEAAEVLRAEGLPASDPTITRDVRELNKGWITTTIQDFAASADEQYIWLQGLKADLANPKIKPDRRIELALSILDREMKLLGTAAPTRSHSTSLNVNADVTAPLAFDFYDRQCFEWKGVPRDRWEEAFLAVRDALQPFKVAQRNIKDEVATICQKFLPAAEEKPE